MSLTTAISEDDDAESVHNSPYKVIKQYTESVHNSPYKVIEQYTESVHNSPYKV